MVLEHGSKALALALAGLIGCSGTGEGGGDDSTSDPVDASTGGSADASPPPEHWKIVDGFDSQAIADAFDRAGPGDTVYFPAGTYRLTEPLPLKSSVNLMGDPSDRPVLEPVGEETLVTRVPGLSDVTIRSLQLRNHRLYLEGADDYSSSNLNIVDCRFFDGAVSNLWNGSYVFLHQIRGVLIEGSSFERSGEAFGGRGVLLSRCHHCVVKDSFIGTNRDLDPGLGYFKTAINVFGYGSATQRSRDVVVVGNVMRRQKNPPCAYSSPEDGDGDVCQDHGLYAWGHRDLQVIGNQIDGWAPTVSGNSLKLRNGELMFVERNRFRDSGVMLFTYERDPAFTHLEHTIVRRNRFDLGNPPATTLADSGLIYFRNFGAPATAGYETEIHLADNEFVSGGQVWISTARADKFCVAGNGVTVKVSNSSGTPATTGCTGSAPWDRPLLGAFSGDFNNDGAADVAHLFAEGESGTVWMMHLSERDGYRLEEWPGQTYVDPDTELYGVHAGDFDGDGFADDIVHWGRFGGDATPSWRAYLGDGRSFQVASFGTDLSASADTVTYGVHVGDFDGDGRDDLVYRGTCADGACWRVQRSTGTSFTSSSWSNGFYASAETATFGIQVGDFDGDGRDDLAYRGRCGGEGTPCWRIQISTGSAFGAGGDFGDAAGFTGESAHLGIRTGDVDGDGRTDIGYIGDCDGARQWRYQVSRGDRFEVTCSDRAAF